MSADAAAELLALQHADSFFPSGSVAFSYGLETLCEEGRARSAGEVRAFLDDQLRRRWATLERSILAAAWDAAGELEELVRIDRRQESLSLAAELREGSKRSGAALLSTHVRLGTAGAREYAELVKRGAAWGHLAVVQGLAWRAVGLSAARVQAMSGHCFCVGALGAALRLGIIGHVAAQEILGALGAVIVDIVRADPLPLEAVHAFTPIGDIAAMRHERLSGRLFSN